MNPQDVAGLVVWMVTGTSPGPDVHIHFVLSAWAPRGAIQVLRECSEEESLGHQYSEQPSLVTDRLKSHTNRPKETKAPPIAPPPSWQPFHLTLTQPSQQMWPEP